MTTLGFRIESDALEDRVQTARVQFLRQPGERHWLELASPLSGDSNLHRALRRGVALQAALCGAERFPAIGRMTDVQAPWDGSFVMDRMVRWVSLGGPL